MKVTNVRIRKPKTMEGKVKAFASVTFDEQFVVHDIKVIEGTNGLFVVMPSRKTPAGKNVDVAHPVNTPSREMIQKAVLDEYDKSLKE